MVAVACRSQATPASAHATLDPLERIVSIEVFPKQGLVGGRACRRLEFVRSGNDEWRCPRSSASRGTAASPACRLAHRARIPLKRQSIAGGLTLVGSSSQVRSSRRDARPLGRRGLLAGHCAPGRIDISTRASGRSSSERCEAKHGRLVVAHHVSLPGEGPVHGRARHG